MSDNLSHWGYPYEGKPDPDAVLDRALRRMGYEPAVNWPTTFLSAHTLIGLLIPTEQASWRRTLGEIRNRPEVTL